MLFKEIKVKPKKELLEKAIKEYDSMPPAQRTGLTNNAIIMSQIYPYLQIATATMHMAVNQSMDLLTEKARNRILECSYIIENELRMALENVKDLQLTPIEFKLALSIAIDAILSEISELATIEFVNKSAILEMFTAIMAYNMDKLSDKVDIDENGYTIRKSEEVSSV